MAPVLHSLADLNRAVAVTVTLVVAGVVVGVPHGVATARRGRASTATESFANFMVTISWVEFLSSLLQVILCIYCIIYISPFGLEVVYMLATTQSRELDVDHIA